MAPVIALYVSKSMDGLMKMIDLPAGAKSKDVRAICKMLQMLRTAFEDKNRLGDEEMSYVYLMKYFNLMNIIKKKPDFIREKRFIADTLGGNNTVQQLMDKLQHINVSLAKRYEALNASDAIKMPTVSSDDIEMASESSVSTTVIDCKTLYNFVTDQSVSMLIMDCRPSHEFEASHLTYKDCVNIPEEVIKKGLSGDSLFRQLDESAHLMFMHRYVKKYIILMDYNSREQNSVRNAALEILRDILMNWDPDVKYGDERLLLTVDGGYETFKLMYPMHVTNPQWSRSEDLTLDISLTDINYEYEYDSVADIKMKDDTLIQPQKFSTMHRPSVNRATKPTSHRYETPNQQEIITKDRAELENKLIATQKELLDKEKYLFELMKNKTNNDNIDIDARKQLVQDQQKIAYDILQLNDVYRNTAVHLEEIDKEIESTPELSNLRYMIQTRRQEIQELDRQHRQYQEHNRIAFEMDKKREAKRMQEERDREQKLLKEERERKKLIAALEANKAIELAKKNKALEDAKWKMAEEQQQTRQPLVDRTNKPDYIIPPKIIIDRNFYPAYGSEGQGLTGLNNLGNTCYMNSIFQCLLNIDALTSYLKDDRYLRHLNRQSKTSGQLVEEFAAVSNEVWSGNYKSISPRDLRFVIGECQETFRGSQQQDSHEFLTIFMDFLHLELLTIPTNLKIETMLPSERAWNEFTKKKESRILQLFYGQIKSTIKCSKCNIESSSYETFSNLSLELPQVPSYCTLEDCLELYFNGEKITDWNCPKCETKRDAVKKLDISKLPPILIIHFKRFYVDYSLTKNSYRKKQTMIKFPLRDFDTVHYLAKLERNQNKSTVYSLCGVSNHYGTMEGGHYTAYCKNKLKNKWYKFDDSAVRQIDDSDVVTSSAYILFYSTLNC